MGDKLEVAFIIILIVSVVVIGPLLSYRIQGAWVEQHISTKYENNTLGDYCKQYKDTLSYTMFKECKKAITTTTSVEYVSIPSIGILLGVAIGFLINIIIIAIRAAIIRFKRTNFYYDLKLWFRKRKKSKIQKLKEKLLK